MRDPHRPMASRIRPRASSYLNCCAIHEKHTKYIQIHSTTIDQPPTSYHACPCVRASVSVVSARLQLQADGHLVQQRRDAAVVRLQVLPEEREGLLRSYDGRHRASSSSIGMLIRRRGGRVCRSETQRREQHLELKEVCSVCVGFVVPCPRVRTCRSVIASSNCACSIDTCPSFRCTWCRWSVGEREKKRPSSVVTSTGVNSPCSRIRLGMRSSSSSRGNGEIRAYASRRNHWVARWRTCPSSAPWDGLAA